MVEPIPVPKVSTVFPSDVGLDLVASHEHLLPLTLVPDERWF